MVSHTPIRHRNSVPEHLVVGVGSRRTDEEEARGQVTGPADTKGELLSDVNIRIAEPVFKPSIRSDMDSKIDPQFGMTQMGDWRSSADLAEALSRAESSHLLAEPPP